MNDHDLDTLFARVREVTPEDAGAADRFLARHPAKREVISSPARLPRWPLLAACAALLAGVIVTRPAPALPASAAYDAYQAAQGEDW